MGKTRIFADGIESVSLTDGLIRMELYTVPARGKKSGADNEITGELLLSPQGFLRGYAAMEDLVKQLIAAGVLKRSDAPAADNAAATTTTTVASPNFN